MKKQHIPRGLLKRIGSMALALSISATVLPLSFPLDAFAAYGTPYSDENIIGGQIYYDQTTAEDGTPAVYISGADGTITSAVIPAEIEGTPVIGIGSRAFEWNKSLESITFPDTLRNIGNSAFHSNDSLAEVKLPEGLTTIESSAFSGCPNLTSITLPSTLTTMGNWAFSTSGLTEITIPDSLTTIAFGAFQQTPLTSVTLPNTVTTLEQNAFSNCGSLSSINLPDSIESIGEGALSGTSVTEFTIPSKVTVIEPSTFANSKQLTKVTLPDGITSIGNYAFSGCEILPDIKLPNELTAIGSKAFNDCKALTSITLPDGLTSMGDSAFYNSGLTAITIPDGITQISYSAFSGCESLTKVTLPKSLKSIDTFAFSGCKALSDINFPDSLTSIGNMSFAYCAFPEAVIPNVTTLDRGSFYNNKALTKVVLGNGLTELPGSLFEGCTSLTEVNIPSELTAIGYSAFLNTGAIGRIELPKTVTSIGNDAFGKSGITEISMPGVMSIGTSAFSNCESLTTVELGEGLTEIPYNMFSNCYSLKNITLPSTLTSIATYAFYRSGLEKAVIPKSVTEIGTYAFEGSALKELTILGAPKMGERVFQDSTALTTVELAEGFTDISNNAFQGCSSLNSVTFPDSLKTIGVHAFWGTALEKVILPVGLESIGNGAFRDNKALTEVTIQGAPAIGKEVFSTNEALTTVHLSDAITALPDDMFYRCKSLKNINFPTELRSIGKSAFSNSGIETAILPDKLESIGTYAFHHTALKVVEINSAVTLGDSVFYQNDELTKVKLAEGITELPGSTFSRCPKLSEINFPSSIKKIYGDAFKYSALTEISLPGVTEINGGAFEGSESLSKVVLGDDITYIGRSAFSGCKNLTEINFPEGLTDIREYAFSNTALTKVELPESLQALGSCAFEHVNNLQDFTIPKNVENLNRAVFLPRSSFDRSSMLIIKNPDIGLTPTNSYLDSISIDGDLYVDPALGNIAHFGTPLIVYAYETNSQRQDSMIKKYYDQYYKGFGSYTRSLLKFRWLESGMPQLHSVTVNVPEGAKAVISQQDTPLKAVKDGDTYTIAEVPSGADINVRISLDGYYSKSFTIAKETFTEDKVLTITTADLTPETLYGKLAVSMNVKDNAEAVSSFDDMTLELTSNGELLNAGTDYVVEYPYIILKDTANVTIEDTLKLTITPGKSYGFAAASSEIIARNGAFKLTFPLRGTINVKTNSEKTDTVVIFDENGKLVTSGDIYDSKLGYSTKRIPAGTYTVVAFNKNDYFETVAEISTLNDLGMVEGEDYAVQAVAVTDGNTSTVNMNVPVLGRKDSIINAADSYIIPKASEVFKGEQLEIRVYYSFADDVTPEKLNISLPKGLTLDYVYSENEKLATSTEVAITKPQGILFFTVKPMELGEYTISASVTADGITAPIGTATFKATELIAEPVFNYIGNKNESATIRVRSLPDTEVTLTGGVEPVKGKTNSAGSLILNTKLPETVQSGQSFELTASTATAETKTSVIYMENSLSIRDFGLTIGGKKTAIRENGVNKSVHYLWEPTWFEEPYYRYYGFYATILAPEQPLQVRLNVFRHGDSSRCGGGEMELVKQTPSDNGLTLYEYAIKISNTNILNKFSLSFTDAKGMQFSYNEELFAQQQADRAAKKAQKAAYWSDMITNSPAFTDWTAKSYWSGLSAQGQSDLTALSGKLKSGYTAYTATVGNAKTIFNNGDSVFDYVDEYWDKAWADSKLPSLISSPEKQQEYSNIQSSFKNTLTNITESIKEFDDLMQSVAKVEQPTRNYSSFNESVSGIGINVTEGTPDTPLTLPEGETINVSDGMQIIQNTEDGTYTIVTTDENGNQIAYEVLPDKLKLTDPTEQKDRLDTIAETLPEAEESIDDLEALYGEGANAADGISDLGIEEEYYGDGYGSPESQDARNTYEDELEEIQTLPEDLGIKDESFGENNPFNPDELIAEIEETYNKAFSRYLQALDLRNHRMLLENWIMPNLQANTCFTQDCRDAVQDEIDACKDAEAKLNDLIGMYLLKVYVLNIKLTLEASAIGGNTIDLNTDNLEMALDKLLEKLDFDAQNALMMCNAKSSDRANSCQSTCDDSILLYVDSNDEGAAGGNFSVTPIIDPSGNVYEAVESNPVKDVTATVYLADDSSGKNARVWNASDFDQVNPQITQADGAYAWDVHDGWWQVRFEKDGYTTATTEWMEVPPPRLNLKTYLVSTQAPQITGVSAYTDYIEVMFSQYMDTAKALNISGISGADYEWQNIETTPDGKSVSKLLYIKKNGGFDFGSRLTFKINGGVNYAGKAMTTAYNADATVSARPARIVFDTNALNAKAGTTSTIGATVVNANGEPIKGLTVSVVNNAETLASITPSSVSGADGRVSFELTANYPGAAELVFNVDGTSLSQAETLNIGVEEVTIHVNAPMRPVVTVGNTVFDMSAPKENEITVEQGTMLSISCATDGVTLYYTTNDTCPCEPDNGRFEYTEPISISEDTYFRIAAFKDGEYSERINIRVKVSDSVFAKITDAKLIGDSAVVNAEWAVDGICPVIGVAVYDAAGRMIALTPTEKDAGTQEFVIPANGAATAKLFMWNDLASMEPITASATAALRTDVVSSAKISGAKRTADGVVVSAEWDCDVIAPVVGAALYDASGKMLALELVENAPTMGKQELVLHADGEIGENVTVKLFLWKDMTMMQPIATAAQTNI